MIKETKPGDNAVRWTVLVGLMAFSCCSRAHASDGPANPSAGKLRVVTINVWSGLDYHGTFSFGEYESNAQRNRRFGILLKQLRELDPDVIFVQEANPVRQYASRLADSLGFDEIHQVCNAGIRVLGLGIPSNFEEGIVILARKPLHLREYDVWKLSGGFGLFGDFMSVNFDEAEFAQVGEITIHGEPVFLINVHLSAFPPNDSVFYRSALNQLAPGAIESEELSRVEEGIAYGSVRRMEETESLTDQLSELPVDAPKILGGDFNSVPGSNVISRLNRLRIISEASLSPAKGSSPTWDPRENANISYSTRFTDARGDSLDLYGKISALYDARARRIDYLFCSRQFGDSSVQNYNVVIDSSYNGVFASDHFGVAADVSLAALPYSENSHAEDERRAHIEPLPILSYDTDTKLGYGAKIFLFDLLHSQESLPCLFQQHKGRTLVQGRIFLP